MKAALCVGHSRPGDAGAESAGGVSEWDFNLPIATRASEILFSRGIEAPVISKYHGQSYGRAMNWLAAHLKEVGADLAVELHFNAAGESAQGFEYLHYHSSSKGKRLAECLHGAHADKFASMVDRGVKPRTPGDRGIQFLKKTHCPAVIAEPFFGSSPEEWRFYSEEEEGLSCVYADGIERYVRG